MWCEEEFCAYHPIPLQLQPQFSCEAKAKVGTNVTPALWQGIARGSEEYRRTPEGNF